MPVLMPGSDHRSRPALALGGAGDVALLGRSDAAFTTGLACFLAGHLAWIRALRQRPGGGAALPARAAGVSPPPPPDGPGSVRRRPRTDPGRPRLGARPAGPGPRSGRARTPRR